MSLKISDASYEERIEAGLKNDFMHQAVAQAQGRMGEGRLREARELGDWEAWRSLGEEIRSHTIEHLDYYLHELSEAVASFGGQVYFAQTEEEARNYIQKVIKEEQAQKVVKSKSMVTEEIRLNKVLQAEGIHVVETDLGEWILQLDEDPPSHIVAPAVHKNKEQIQATFAKKRGYEGTSQPEELALFARQELRKEFLTADVGITGCNFAVAETGTITLVTNEGNGRLVSALPKTLISVMGMERIVPTWEELEVLVSLLTRSAVGQKLTSYITTLTGPKRQGEADGPENFHLVIVDNGRSKMLGTEFQSALHCIRCAACLNVCPVYRHIGGHAYGSIYPGPIGAVITPLLDGYEEHYDLPYASSLCAACTEACPVKIPLHEQLIRHREIIAEKKYKKAGLEKLAMKGFATWASHPAAYRLSRSVARFALKPWTKDERLTKGPGPLKAWTKARDFPTPAKESFRSWFKKRKEGVSSS